jgi:class 3 adenylate cyclase
VEPPPKLTENLLLERLRLDQELERHRHLMAVMFVDVAGSTRFYEQRGDLAGMVMVQRMEALLLPLIQQHAGVVVKTIGDAVMSRFETAEAAVRCAVQIQRNLARQNADLSETDHLRMRAAINFGLGFLRGNDVFGDSVNVAARIEGLAEPGEILISPSAYDQIRQLDDLPVRCKTSGAELKGKAQRLDLYQVLWQEDAPRLPHPAAPSSEQLRMATGVMLAAVPVPRPAAPFVLARLYTDGSLAERYPLDRAVLIAGHGPVGIPLPKEPGLAEQHARLELRDGLHVEELDSEHGVFVRLREGCKLSNGDVLIAGEHRFRFETGAAAQAAAFPGARPPGAMPSPSPSAALVLLDDANRETGRFALAGETAIGRTQGIHAFVDDFMSGKHCRITPVEGQFILEDLGSTNGTFVRIRGRRQLSEGDVVRLGSCLLKVLIDSA